MTKFIQRTVCRRRQSAFLLHSHRGITSSAATSSSPVRTLDHHAKPKRVRRVSYEAGVFHPVHCFRPFILACALGAGTG